MQNFVVHVPRWLRWGLLGFLLLMVVGFTLVFFLGIGRDDYGAWIQPAVSIVQIALTALAYVALVFFAESGRSPKLLQSRADEVLTRLLPQAFNRITDLEGEQVSTVVGKPSGIVGRAFELTAGEVRLRLWVGLNVHRAIVAYYCALPSPDVGPEFLERINTVFGPTIAGARAVGYSEPVIKFEEISGFRFVSIWMTWGLSEKDRCDDFLTNSPRQLFFAQDVALMTQSFLRTAQRNELTLATEREPAPL